MDQAATISAYRTEANEWLNAAQAARETAPEPAAFNALHALELALKAALVNETGTEYMTHNVGGEFAKYYRDDVGKETCRTINKYLMQYDTTRYPGEELDNPHAIIDFVDEFVKETLPAILES